MAKAILKTGAAAATPVTGSVALYAKADGFLYSKDDAGTETPLGGLVGGGIGWSQINGTRSAGVAIANADTIPYAASKHRILSFVAGSGGAVSASLANGNSNGDEHLIIGTHATNTIQLSSSNQEMNGNYLLTNGSSILFVWCASTSTWLEVNRNGL